MCGSIIDDIQHGLEAGVIAQMTARASDAASEQALAVGTIKRRVTGSFCAEFFGQLAIEVKRDVESWDRAGSIDQCRICPGFERHPACGETRGTFIVNRLVKQDGRLEAISAFHEQ